MRVAIALIALLSVHAVIACPFAGLDSGNGRKLLQRPGGGAVGAGNRPGAGAGAAGGGAANRPGGANAGGAAGGAGTAGAGGAGAAGAAGAGGAGPAPRPGGGAGGGGANPGPTCNLNAAAIDAPGPSSQTATDALVKQTVFDYLSSILKTATGAINVNLDVAGFVRAAFHDAGTYNKAAGTGGANGSLVSSPESMTMAAHRGLAPAIRSLARWRTEINARLPNGLQVSYADLIQLTGALAVEITGGPALYKSVPVGRVDTSGTTADATTQLPDQNDPYNTIACKFVSNGYSVAEMYALTGAHTLGVVNRNGVQVNLDPTPTSFDLAYWQLVQRGQGVLRSDVAMGAANPGIINNYAGNQAAFYNDFVNAFVKMGKQGATWKSYGV